MRELVTSSSVRKFTVTNLVETQMRALAVSTDSSWTNRLIGRAPTALSPSVFIKPIASGEKLVVSRSSPTAQLVGHAYGDAVAFDMEGYGFSKAAHANRGLMHLVVRGISDCLDDKNKLSDAADQEVAVAHAAAVAFHIVHLLPVPQSGEGEQAKARSPMPRATKISNHVGNMSLVITDFCPGRLSLDFLSATALFSGAMSHQPASCSEVTLDIRPYTDSDVSITFRLPSTASSSETSFAFTMPDNSVALLLPIAEVLLSIAAGMTSEATVKLVALSSDDTAPSLVRALLLDEAAKLSLRNDFRYSFEIATSALSLDRLEPWLVRDVSMALLGDLIRFEFTGNERAQDRAHLLLAALASKQLVNGGTSEEILYQLSRNAGAKETQLRLFYCLAHAFPDYMSRWYWHRDVAVLHYELGQLTLASQHYDQAARLKANFSKLYRYSGDSYYYSGLWAEAARRYKQALAIEPLERFFVQPKLNFCEREIFSGRSRTRHFVRRRRIAASLSRAGAWTFDHWSSLAAVPLLRLSIVISPLIDSAARLLALRANRQGRYSNAIEFQRLVLASVPENPIAWLNGALDMVFANRGNWTQDARAWAEAAVFHGGPEMAERLAVQLVRTPAMESESLIQEFKGMIPQLKALREDWWARQMRILGPEDFGRTTHWEIPTGL